MDYRPLTTVAGIVEKNTGVELFDASEAALLDGIAKGDFGSTIDPTLKTQTVGLFMTNLDTTGGNPACRC